MSHASSTSHGSLQRRSRTFWLASWLLVGLYLVASGRAFIPGICATQRAMDARCATSTEGPSMRGLRTCCAMSMGEEGESDAPIAPGDSGCALCKLVSSSAPLSATVYVPIPPKPEYGPPQACIAQFFGTRLVGTAQDRAPPLSTLS